MQTEKTVTETLLQHIFNVLAYIAVLGTVITILLLSEAYEQKKIRDAIKQNRYNKY